MKNQIKDRQLRTYKKVSFKQLQELQSSILSAIPHAVIGLKERTIFFANDAVERVFGWKPQEIIGKKTLIFYRNQEDYEEIGRRFYPLLEKQRTHIEDFPCKRKDGKEILCRVSASIIGKEMTEKGIIVMYEDITEQKNIEEKLKESERKYRELVENANSIILKWNSKGEITFMNEYGQAFFGYSEQEILGRHVVGTIVPETESTGRDLRPLIDQICADPKAFEKNINENMKRDGSRVWVAWTNKAIFDQKGKIIEVFSVGTDITDLKKAEEELTRYREHLEELVKERTQQLEIVNRELEQSNIKLKELDRLKSMFIASMSHELRTPLNSIIGFTGMTLKGLSGELNDEQKDNLSRVYKSAKHLLSMITDIIDISKIEAGRVDVYYEDISLKDIIDEAIITIEPQLKDKGLTLNVDVEDIKLKTDRRRILQCLINLLSNAVKFTEKGSVRVTARLVNSEQDTVNSYKEEKELFTKYYSLTTGKTDDYSLTSNGNFVEISVEDTGIGIAEKDMPKLFEAFERLDTHLRVKTGGTGLGLYLTRKIVTDILHGSISVVSKEGQGSTFTIRIPRDI